MKQLRTLLYYTSILFFAVPFASFAQETSAPAVDAWQKYGIRVGVDVSKPLRSLFDSNYNGFEVMGDYRLYEDWFVAGEIGFDEFIYDEPNFEGSTNGSYFKLGANYNAYQNWIGMNNEIYAGLRFGFSSFSQQLDRYRIYSTSSYFGEDIRDVSVKYDQLNASWAELMLGIKVEVLNNLFLGVHVQLKRRMSDTRPSNFENLYIPGFHRTYDGSSAGVGYGYSVSYMIPFYKK